MGVYNSKAFFNCKQKHFKRFKLTYSLFLLYFFYYEIVIYWNNFIISKYHLSKGYTNICILTYSGISVCQLLYQKSSRERIKIYLIFIYSKQNL